MTDYKVCDKCGVNNQNGETEIVVREIVSYPSGMNIKPGCRSVQTKIDLCSKCDKKFYDMIIKYGGINNDKRK